VLFFFLAKGKLSLVIDYQLKKKDKAQNDKKILQKIIMRKKYMKTIKKSYVEN
jgi:hypothetical protein